MKPSLLPPGLVALMLAATARADDPAPGPDTLTPGRRVPIARMGPGPLPFEIAAPQFLGELFPAALVMQHQRAIALRDDQRAERIDEKTALGESSG